MPMMASGNAEPLKKAIVSSSVACMGIFVLDSYEKNTLTGFLGKGNLF